MLMTKANAAQMGPLRRVVLLLQAICFMAVLISHGWTSTNGSGRFYGRPHSRAVAGKNVTVAVSKPLCQKAGYGRFDMSRNDDAEVIEIDPQTWKAKAQTISAPHVIIRMTTPEKTDRIKKHLPLYLLHNTILC
ncbi:MAG: hypothetical protein PVH87_13380 [Desulfobacteraceae bacterium]|jgi:hypothetical protein